MVRILPGCGSTVHLIDAVRRPPPERRRADTVVLFLHVYRRFGSFGAPDGRVGMYNFCALASGRGYDNRDSSGSVSTHILCLVLKSLAVNVLAIIS